MIKMRAVKRIFAFVLCVAMMVALLAGCGAPAANSGGAAPAASSGGAAPTTNSGGAPAANSGETKSKPPIKIGVLTPLTGPTAANGLDVIAAMEMWAEQHNNTLGGFPVELIVDRKSVV